MIAPKEPRYYKFLPLAAVLAVAVIVRAVIYQMLPSRGWPGYNQILYFEALTKHLGEYLMFTSLKPPLTYLIHAATFNFVGLPQAHMLYIHLLVAFALDCLAVVLLYMAALRLGLNRYLTAAVLLVYTLAYIPFEMLWEGSHYDHHTLFFTCLFIYCMTRAITSRTIGNLLMVSIAGGLLIAQSTVNAMSASAAILVLAFFLARNSTHKYRAFFRDASVAMFCPVLVLVGLSAKNYISAGVMGTSNLAGPAAIMVVQRAMDFDDAKVRELMVESGAPDWYLWAYDNAIKRIDEKGVPAPWPYSKAFGICYPKTNPDHEYWPHDYRPLRDKLLEMGQKDLAAVVDKDVADSRERRYLFAGFSPELSPRWIGQYGKVSVKVYRHLLTNHGGVYLKSIARCHKVFHNYGGRLPRHLLAEGSRTLPKPIPLEGLLYPFVCTFRWVAWLGYRLLYLGWVGALAIWIWKIIKRRKSSGWDSAWLGPFAVLSVPALLMTAVFSTMVGAENSRYFMQISPYLMILIPLCLAAVVSRPQWCDETLPPQDTDDLEYVNCDLCGVDDCKIFLPGRRMRPLAESNFTVLGERGEYPQLVKCNACSLVYANPRDKPKDLTDKYRQMSISEYLLEEDSRRLTAARDAKMLKRYVSGGRVLDVGCSAGLFLDCLGDSFERYGIEPGADSSEAAKKLIGENSIHNGTLDSADLPVGSFEAVTMWDVIEHTTNPKLAMEKVARLLKDDGYFILATPNIASPLAMLTRGNWPHLIRSHVYYFTPRTLKKMLRKCGFEVVYRSGYSRKFTIRYLLERIGLIQARSHSTTESPSGFLNLWNVTIPVDSLDAFVMVARKIKANESSRC